MRVHLLRLVLVLLFLIPLPAYAQEGAPVPRGNGELLFAADFSAGGGGVEPVFGPEWMTMDTSGGVATLSSQTPGALLAAAVAGRTFDNFIAEVDVRPESVRADAQYGFYFRSSDVPNVAAALYTLTLMPYENRLSLWYAPAGEGAEFEIIQWNDLNRAAYNPNGFNTIRLEAVGSQFRIFVNGQHLLDAQDGRLSSGSFGLILGVPGQMGEGEVLRGAYDNLRVYAPGAEAPPAAAPEAAAPAPEGDEPAAEAAPQALPDGIPARVTSTIRLNVRGGTGTTFPIVAKLNPGDQVLATGRDAACAWVYVYGGSAPGWVTSRYVRLDAPCSSLPVGTGAETAAETAPAAGAAAADVTTTPTVTVASTTSVAAADAQPAAAAPAPAASLPASATVQLVTDFEQFGTWRRGDERWGTFVASREQAAGGRASGKLAYDFPANVPNGQNYVVFLRSIPIPGSPDGLSIDVYGDGSGSILNVWVRERSGQVWQFTFGPITHRGWRTLYAPLDTARPWPVSVISGGGADSSLDFPLSLHALVLDYPNDSARAGAIYLDNLNAVTAP